MYKYYGKYHYSGHNRNIYAAEPDLRNDSGDPCKPNPSTIAVCFVAADRLVSHEIASISASVSTPGTMVSGMRS